MYKIVGRKPDSKILVMLNYNCNEDEPSLLGGTASVVVKVTVYKQYGISHANNRFNEERCTS